MSESEAFNAIPFEKYKQSSNDIANKRNIEVEVIAWTLDHPDEPLPKELYDRQTQWFIDLAEKRKRPNNSLIPDEIL